MDGRGAWRDKVFVERPRRSVKYERAYLKADDSVNAARADIAEYISWHNAGRAHPAWPMSRPTSTTSRTCRPWKWRHKMKSLVRPALPTALIGSLQAPTASVDNSAPSATRPQPT